MKQLVRSVFGDNLLFHVSITPWLRLQQEAEWININIERRDLNSFHRKVTLSPMVLEKLAFSFAFNLKKKCHRFFFHLFNTRSCAVPLNYYCQALWVSPHCTNGGLSDNGCSSVPLASTSSRPWYLALPDR